MSVLPQLEPAALIPYRLKPLGRNSAAPPTNVHGPSGENHRIGIRTASWRLGDDEEVNDLAKDGPEGADDVVEGGEAGDFDVVASGHDGGIPGDTRGVRCGALEFAIASVQRRDIVRVDM